MKVRSRSSVVLFSGMDETTEDGNPKLWLPLSTLAIGTALNADGYDVVMLDKQVDTNWQQQLIANAGNAIFIGVSCLTGSGIRNVLHAIDIARSADKTVPIVWGGYHATLAYEGILRERLADAAVIGPGERSAVALAHLYSLSRMPAHESLASISGIAIPVPGRGGGGMGEGYLTATQAQMGRNEEMDALAPLNYDLVNPVRYYNSYERKLPYISSYGCAYACTYCVEPVNSGRRWKPLSAVRVAQDVAQAWRKYSPDIIDFMDPNFSTNPRRVCEIVEELLGRGINVQLMANMRSRDVLMIGKLMDLRRLRAAGFVRIFIGVESGSDRILAALKKGSTAEHAMQASMALSSAGIEVLTSFIHDLPGESEQDSNATLELAMRLAALPGNIQAHHFFMPYPGTEAASSIYGDLFKVSRIQSEWASASTYQSNALWPGRPSFRANVLSKLRSIRESYPAPFRIAPLPSIETTSEDSGPRA